MPVRRFYLWSFCGLLLLSGLAGLGPGSARAQTGAVPQALRGWLEAATEPQQLWVGCEPVYAGKELVDFYRGRDYQPVWVSENGPSEAARELLDSLGQAERHGLFPRDYHFACLAEWLKQSSADRSSAIEAKELAGMEIVLSDAFANYANHLAAGKVDPETVYPHWISVKKKTEVFELLGGIAAPQDVHSALDGLAPQREGYRTAMIEARRLRAAIASKSWREIATGQTLHVGDRSPIVQQVRARLIGEGDPAGSVAGDQEAEVFDGALEKAVTRFQHRHGLAPDGAIGRKTLAALNRSPEDRLRCVLVNLERWRWLPRDLGRRYLIVNPAAFELEAFQEGRKVLEMPVIVGEAYTKTPVFSRNMAYLVVNPYWNVPQGVLARKILPKIKKNPGYIAANHFELIRGWKEPAVAMDPTLIDWSKVHVGNFPGRLRQSPGPWNALGRIKFIFPNDFSVYLHDTPDRHLFQRTARAFSSGCIRVEKPIDLALFVLQPDPSWDRERLERLIEEGKTTTVAVKDPVTVHLQYWTFWIGDEGEAQYREDIYDRDGVLWKALTSNPETAPPTPPARVRPEVDPNVRVEPSG